MKKTLLILMLAFPLVCFSQNKEETKKLTKFEEFSSKTGAIMKFIDTELPGIPLHYSGWIDSGIRTVIGTSKNHYFFRIEKAETSNSVAHIAMIEYSDLLEINKALLRILSEVDGDIQSNPDYLENKFITEDGFEIGYYISKGKASWFMKLEGYSSSSVFVKDAESVITAFKNAQAKIEELKGKYGK